MDTDTALGIVAYDIRSGEDSVRTEQKPDER